MWKSLEVENLNNSGPKMLPWDPPETTSTDALTLPLKSPCAALLVLWERFRAVVVYIVHLRALPYYWEAY